MAHPQRNNLNRQPNGINFSGGPRGAPGAFNVNGGAFKGLRPGPGGPPNSGGPNNWRNGGVSDGRPGGQGGGFRGSNGGSRDERFTDFLPHVQDPMLSNQQYGGYKSGGGGGYNGQGSGGNYFPAYWS